MRDLRVIAILGPGALLVCLAVGGGGCREDPTGTQAGAPDAHRARQDNLAWFQDAKLGLFIHWGPACLTGQEMSWSRWGPRPALEPANEGIPAEQYDQLYKRFAPTLFDADEWVALAQAAGARYLVFTTKHHDGFSMFDTRWSDYDIMHAPVGRDVCAELASACHKAGLKLGWYYSPTDWYHPDYMHPEQHHRYVMFMHRQLKELCSRYGKVTMLWFDVAGGYPYQWDTNRLLSEVRRLQKGVLINDRLSAPSDYMTVEQETNPAQTDKLWENAWTLGTQWSYKPNDQIRTLPECIQVLVRTVGAGGNLLVNVGPAPTGQIPPSQAQRLREVGRWLASAGESIYGTRGGPFRPGAWGAAAQRGKKIYLHILDWSTPVIALPAIDARVVGSRLLTGGDAEVAQSDRAIEITVSPAGRDEVDTIVVLELDRPAEQIKIEP